MTFTEVDDRRLRRSPTEATGWWLVVGGWLVVAAGQSWP